MAETAESSLIVPLARPVKARPRTGMTGAPQPITLHDPVEKPKTPASAAAGAPDPVADLDPEREVGAEEKGHGEEAEQVSDRDGDAPLDPPRVVRGEPEQGEVREERDPLAERHVRGHEVMGQRPEPGVEREVVA